VSINRDGVINATLIGTMAGDAYEAQNVGTVAVNDDCTATSTATMTIGASVSHLSERLMILDNGDEIVNMSLTSPYRGVGGNVLKRLSKSPVDQFTEMSPCSTEMVRGTYSFRYEGEMFMSTPGSPSLTQMHSHMLGMAWLDTANRMPGKFDFNLAGTVTSGEWTTEPGALTVNPNCTASITWKLTGENAPSTEGIDKFVVLDHGRELWSLTVKGAMGKASNIGIYKQISTLPLK
jgi:hypothetical protein